jgi:hypothetical protein
MKTDESLNSGWYTIPDYEGSKFSNLLETSNALYGMSSDNQLNRCSDNKCDIVDTQGMNPSSLSMEPTTKSVWMTTTNEGTVGNLFNKQDSIDYSSTMKTINDIEEKRDQIKDNIKLESEKNKSTSFIITELRKLKTFFDEFFKNKPKEIPPEIIFLEKVSKLYFSLNKSPSLYLDNIPNNIDFGPYWFSMNINKLTFMDDTISIPLYFRKKQRKYSEFEILFNRPLTGIIIIIICTIIIDIIIVIIIIMAIILIYTDYSS